MSLQTTYRAVSGVVDSQQDTSCLLLREDFDLCGPKAEVDAALARLVEKGSLAQLREDAFAYTMPSTLSDKLILRCSLQNLAQEYATRKGATIRDTDARLRNLRGESTQVPNGRFVGVDRPIEGQLQFRQRSVRYECV